MGITDERVEEMNDEIGKAIFQVAVSPVMSGGTLTTEQTAEIYRLKSLFAPSLQNGIADAIVSQVGVMRVLHKLQNFLLNQDVTLQVRPTSLGMSCRCCTKFSDHLLLFL